ncbi:hypothetical protein HYPSUDRAFT_196135 [Hypholoma sublateritium FD-334 SS-4]|uniref:Uncharacterized protein n=1 Tax=Hypholoma sublateritium (strain FD-334 SS-4) TaxID=945553 RepID=A0A0D2PNN3_HYPSF|nr:hypothetical protein HYPSUDRAFT_196135 [Hypholoma sublateritium FD-334 SS-4]
MPPNPEDPASNPSSASEAGGASKTDALAKCREFLDSMPIINELAELSRWFGLLNACDDFHHIPVRELLEFTRELANKIDIQCTRGNGNNLQPWASRVLYLTKTIKKKASTSLLSFQDSQEVEALVARAHAFEGKFVEAKEYISQRMGSEGTRKAVSQDDFNKFNFYQVLTSIVLSLNTWSWESSILYLFQCSYSRWKKTTQMGVDKFLVDKKLNGILQWTVAHPVIFQSFLNLSEMKFPAAEKYHFEEMLDFLLAALNGNEQYHTAKVFIVKLHAAGKSCSASLVVETIRGILSDWNSNSSHEHFVRAVKQITQIPQQPRPEDISASGSKKRSRSDDTAASEDSDTSGPPSNKPSNGQSHQDK